MPGLLVVLTMGYLCFLHGGAFVRDGTFLPLDTLEQRYLDAGGEFVGRPVNRLWGRMGLDANRVVRRDGELYFLPDIEHVAGRSFLHQSGKNSHVVLKQQGRTQRAQNPISAIRAFSEDLRERGIRLVLMPTPSKAMFAGPESEPVRNVGFSEFLEIMERLDIPVFDPAPHLASYEERGNRLFLKSDSHWTPETMRMCAVLLSAFLQQEDHFPEQPAESFEGLTRLVTNTGDLGNLLDDGSAGWKETVKVHPLRGWSPKEASPLLLLGDSFSNVFSDEMMDWGANAGFAEALSQALGFSVDRIAVNDGGALESRRALASSAGRLEGKKVVVWQFAARELSHGDWKILPLPATEEAESPLAHHDFLTGTIAELPKIPSLVRTPYRWAVMEVRLVDVVVDGAREAPEKILILGPAVLNRRLTPMAKWRVGQRFRMRFVPWSERSETKARWHRFALDDPDFELIDAPRYWVEMWGEEDGDLQPWEVPP